MNQVNSEKQTLKCKKPIIILSLVSLIFTVLSCITYFVYYEWRNSYYELAIRFPDAVSLLSLLITLAPHVLMVVYILKFYNQFKATVLVPVILGLIAISPVFYLIINSIIGGYGYPIIDIIFVLSFAISFGLATYSSLKRFNKKIFLIIATSIGLLQEALSFIYCFESYRFDLEKELYLYPFTWIIGLAGAIALYIALLLFGLKNRIPAIVSTSPEKEKKKAENLTPEQALRMLKDKLDLGMITEEEYQAQRADIISKL